MCSRRKNLVLSPVLLFAFLFLANCHGPAPVLSDSPQLAAGVSMQDVNFQSAALGREMRYRVYLPQQIPAGQRLPVVYLLHGNGGSYRDWSNHSSIATYALHGLILVMP